MISEEIRRIARQNMTLCNACPVCDGRGCRGRMPGPGGKGGNENFIRSYEKLREIRINMEFLHQAFEADASFSAFGRDFRYPVFAAPVGMLEQNFGPRHNDRSYAEDLLEGCERAGIGAFTGDGPAPGTFEGPLAVIEARGGGGIPTVKNWSDVEKTRERLRMALDSGSYAVAMDVDCVGLVPGNPRFTTRSVDELSALKGESIPAPFIIKGVMTARDAEKALHAGASGIVVSTHGGRVLADAPAPVEVLPLIAEAVRGRMTLLVDGAIRTGADVFKALALGADAVLVGRPFVVAAYGGGADAVAQYAEALGQDLRHTMMLAGTPTLKDIRKRHLF